MNGLVQGQGARCPAKGSLETGMGRASGWPRLCPRLSLTMVRLWGPSFTGAPVLLVSRPLLAVELGGPCLRTTVVLAPGAPVPSGGALLHVCAALQGQAV